jgi:type II secretory pathway pseudopilin PulG
MTLVEVVLSLAISALAVAGIVSGYIFSTASAQKWALSLAANAKAMERIEETRSAKWDTSSWPVVDQVSAANFPDQIVALDQWGSGAVTVYATNVTYITQISVDPPLKRIRVDCIWRFKGNVVLTNTIETCRAPDQ